MQLPTVPEETGPLTQESVEEQLEEFSFCEVDSDCGLVDAPCPFGCRKVVNNQFISQATELMELYRIQQREL